MLDERFRSAVKELADAAPPDLDEAARERIARAVAARGPSAIRRGRALRVGVWMGAAAMAAAAAVVLAVAHRSNESLPVVAAQPPKVASQRACEGRSVLASAEFETRGGALELDLGEAVRAVATSRDHVSVLAAEPCHTVIGLETGRVVVHARDLGGGELTVRAGHVEVSVRGTLFAVSYVRSLLEVSVVEGVVDVRDGSVLRRLTAGQTLVGDVALSWKVEGLAAEHANAIRRSAGQVEVVALDSLPPEAAPSGSAVESGNPASPSVITPRSAEPSPQIELEEAVSAPAEHRDLIVLAEEKRRAGEHDAARELYRRAGTERGATAEAAWLGLARMELSLGNVAGARAASAERQRRFASGTLGPEATWIDVRIHRAAGDEAAARARARSLLERWPRAAQADAARRYLEGR